MRITTFPKALIVLVLALGLVAAACSSSEPEEATTTTGAVDDRAVAVATMCRTLELLSAASVPPGNAAASIVTTDLDGLTASEKAEYGDVLVLAPREECTDQIAYADEIAYWLGF